jgi:hypothetical protein
MLEIKTEIISDGDEEEDIDDDVDEEEEGEENRPDSLPAVTSTVSYIIAHGPNGLISIPRR